jgi:adenylate cyclase
MNRFSSALKKTPQQAVIGIIGILIATLFHVTGFLNVWEAKTWDWRARFLASPGKATDQIRIILLDQQSLDWIQKESHLTWPWPREVYAAIIDFCSRSKARAVGFDVLFLEPSPYGVSDDENFGKALSSFGHVAGAVFLSNQNNEKKVAFPIPEIRTNLAQFGHVNHLPDPDAIFRQALLFIHLDDRIIPCLALGVILAEKRLDFNPGSDQLNTDFNRMQPDKKGSAILKYRGPISIYNPISAASIIQSEIRIREGMPPTISLDTLKDKYVFFGFSAPGLMDLRPTPVGNIYPGVGIHATVLDNYLSNDFIAKTPVALAVLMISFFSIISGSLIIRFQKPLMSLLLGILFILSPIGIAVAGYVSGIWIPLMDLEVAGLIPLSLGILSNYAMEGRQKRYIKKAFAQYLSPKVIEQLVQNPGQLKLGGERKPLSIFFSDLQGFTSISERLTPEELTHFLNTYLSEMTEIIHQEEGTVDKYEGDAIIAFWNAPVAVWDHAVRAVKAALRCQSRLSEIAPMLRNKVKSDLVMRIGINTGEAVVGNMGSQSRFDYTVLGDAVNLASRLEGVNKEFGTRILISKATADLLTGDFFCREIGRVAVVGRKEPVTVFEPMFLEAYNLRKNILNIFAEGLGFFYSGSVDKAFPIFSSLGKSDPPAMAYAKRCKEVNLSDRDSWQGIWVMTRK